MFECCDIPSHLCQFPTELIIYIFKYLPAKDFIACRQVCRRWKEVIDDLSSDDDMWEYHCKRDFRAVYRDAKLKSNSCRLWFDIYRSLSLWCRLSDATEVRDEFCHAAVSNDEILDMHILKYGEVSILKRAWVVYYDISTLELSARSPVHGEFVKFVEYRDAYVFLSSHLHLNIIKQLNFDSTSASEQGKSTYLFIKQFSMFGNDLYFVNINNAIFYCDIEKYFKTIELPQTYDGTVITISFCKGLLHVITAECCIYVFENNTFVKIFSPDRKIENIFDLLWQYEFLENMDWHVFNFVFCRDIPEIPEGPLKNISIVKVYGDVFCVGCRNGVVLIYYKPFVDCHLDFFKHKPVKQYMFAEREDVPVLSLQPILKIDIAEVKGGHKILVAMPKKVIVITYIHKFEVEKTAAIAQIIPTAPGISVENL